MIEGKLLFLRRKLIDFYLKYFFLNGVIQEGNYRIVEKAV